MGWSSSLAPEPRAAASLAMPFLHLRRRERHTLRALVGALREPAASEAAEVAAVPVSEVMGVLERHQLATYWAAAMRRRGRWDSLPAQLRHELARAQARQLLVQLHQEQASAGVFDALDEAAVPYVVFKGRHLAYDVYRDPSERPYSDVDLLVRPADRPVAAQVLTRLGFTQDASAGHASHEAVFSRDQMRLDLHWHLFRPGRARVGVTEDIVERRRRLGSVWVPDEVSTLMILLVHPALTDYVTARFIRAIDLHLWLRDRGGAWDEVVRWLERLGLRAAAWATLAWARDWIGDASHLHPPPALHPGALHASYLGAWLRIDPAGAFRLAPNFTRLAFSLALHDRGADAARSILDYALADHG